MIQLLKIYYLKMLKKYDLKILKIYFLLANGIYTNYRGERLYSLFNSYLFYFSINFFSQSLIFLKLSFGDSI